MKLKCKLSKFTVKFLENKGKKDAKRNVIRFGNNKKEFLSSPFFEQEIALCLVRIHRECELLARQKINVLNKRSLFDKKRRKIEIRINNVNFDLKHGNEMLEKLSVPIGTTKDEDITNYMLPGDSFLSDSKNVSKEFRHIEQQAKIEFNIARTIEEIKLLSKAINKKTKEKTRLNDKALIFEEKYKNCDYEFIFQYDSFIEKCKQHCFLTISRLSAYWSGVIEFYNGKSEIYAQFNNDVLFKDLYNLIYELEENREDLHL